MATIKTKLVTPDISCGHCKATIEAAVGRLPGVTAAEADVARRVATVEHDPARASVAAVAGAVEEAGYRVADWEAAS